jgi:hypothetical protein
MYDHCILLVYAQPPPTYPSPTHLPSDPPYRVAPSSLSPPDLKQPTLSTSLSSGKSAMPSRFWHPSVIAASRAGRKAVRHPYPSPRTAPPNHPLLLAGPQLGHFLHPPGSSHHKPPPPPSNTRHVAVTPAGADCSAPPTLQSTQSPLPPIAHPTLPLLAWLRPRHFFYPP